MRVESLNGIVGGQLDDNLQPINCGGLKPHTSRLSFHTNNGVFHNPLSSIDDPSRGPMAREHTLVLAILPS